MLIFTLIIIVLTVFAIVYVQQGRRNVPVMYPGRRMGGSRMSMPVKGTLAVDGEPGRHDPADLCQCHPAVPGHHCQLLHQNCQSRPSPSFFTGVQNFFGGTGTNNWGYWLLYFFMVVIFTFFYTSVLFDQQNYGENLKKVGANIPGVHTGAPTQKYLSRVQRRITLPGAVFLGVVAIMPFLLSLLLNAFGMATASSSAGLFLVSSSGLLIVVGVVRDTFMNIDAELKAPRLSGLAAGPLGVGTHGHLHCPARSSRCW